MENTIDTMNNLKQKCNNIMTNFANLNLYIFNNNTTIPYENLILLELSVNDLAKQMQSIFYLINEEKTENDNDNNNNDNDNNNNNDNKTTLEYLHYDKCNNDKCNNDIFNEYENNNKLVDKTLINLMPLFFLYIMMIDKNSILNSKTFNTQNDDLNGLPYMSDEAKYDIIDLD